MRLLIIIIIIIIITVVSDEQIKALSDRDAEPQLHAESRDSPSQGRGPAIAAEPSANNSMQQSTSLVRNEYIDGIRKNARTLL